MVVRSRAWIAALAAAALCGIATAGGQAPPPVDELLRRAADYIDEYERQFSGVVSEERYVQMSNNVLRSRLTTRRLRSDVLLIRTKQNGWVNFRDVFEVDGRAVRDRNERLYKLFLSPTEDTLAQAKLIVEESARFNLGMQDGTLIRTLNLPTLALAFLRRDLQDRLTFRTEGLKMVADNQVVQLKYVEHATPRMVKTIDDTPVAGKFWIEPASGRIVQTEMVLRSPANDAVIRVTYAAQPGIEVWVPASMTRATS